MDKPTTLPAHLATIWDELADDMDERIGAAGMEALSGQVYRMREAQRRITEEGLVVQDSKGNPVPHPALGIEKTAQAEVRAWTDKYARRYRKGINP
jgi:hypothetical protein